MISNGRLLEITTAATRCVLVDRKTKAAAAVLLKAAIEHTESEFGFFGIVVAGPKLQLIATNLPDCAPQSDVMSDYVGEEQAPATFEMPYLDNLLGNAICRGESVIENAFTSNSDELSQLFGLASVRRLLATPIRAADGVLGLIGVANRNGDYSKREQDSLATIAQLAGLICDRFRHQEQVCTLSQECRSALDALAESERRFAQLVSSIDDVFWLYNCERECIEYISPAFQSAWGLDPVRILEDPQYGLNTIVMPDCRERVRNEFRQGIHTGRFETTYRIQLPDGSERWILDRGFPVRDAQGKVVRIAGIARDFTARRFAEERLRESEQLLRTTLDSMPARIAIVDSDGVIHTTNLAWHNYAQAHGIPAAQISTGAQFLDLFGSAIDFNAAASRDIADWLRQALVCPDSEAVREHSVQTANERRWFELRVASLIALERGLRVVTVLDISMRKLTEENTRRQQSELAHMSRIATIGEMAAGIAHELNQPLAAIANYSEGCLDRIQRPESDPKQIADALRHIRDLAQSSGAIIRHLRTIARKSEPRRSSVQLNSVVDDAVQLVRHEFDVGGITLEMELTDGLPVALVDPVQIQQVLLNLLLNAFAAVKDRPVRRVTVITRCNTDELEVSVRDTGEGFNGQPPEKLFESFFSTKPDGLGLGLPLSRSIVAEHGGRIWADRIQNQTIFQFTLPLTSQCSDHCPPAGAGGSAVRTTAFPVAASSPVSQT